MNKRNKLMIKLESAISGYIKDIVAIESHADDLWECLKLLTHTYQNKNTIFIAGNGGSAADAQHIAAELVGRFRYNRRPISAIALSTDTSCLTALSNDFGYEHVFERQIQAHASPGDLLWLLSVSGNSPNIVKALEFAKSHDVKTILFTGNKCDNISKSDVSLVVNSSASDVVQGCHQFCYHFLCDCIESQLIESNS